TKAAAGLPGLIKAALALHHKVLPPTIKVEQPIDVLAPGRSPFYVNTDQRPWLPPATHPRRAAVSSFGFGGSNYHCILEEHQADKANIVWDERVQVLAYSEPSVDELRHQLSRLTVDTTWEDLKREGTRSRGAFSHRHGHRLILVLDRDQPLERVLDQY